MNAFREVVVFVCCLIFITPTVNATLTPTVIEDSAEELQVTWVWDRPEEGSGSMLDLDCWYVSLGINLLGNNWMISIEAYHKTYPCGFPHELYGDTYNYTGFFPENEMWSFTDADWRPHWMIGTGHDINEQYSYHKDYYTFSGQRMEEPFNSAFGIFATHPPIPEPATILLLTLGGLVFRRKR